DRSTISARRRIACLPTAVLRRCGIDLRQVLLRRGERALDRRGVPVIGGMERRRDDDAGIEIDGVLGLVGQVRPTVLQLGDLGLWIGPADPLLVRQLLTLAGPGNTYEIVRTRRLNAALLGHLRQHFAVGPAIVA